MFTATKDLVLPSTTTGSFPRPRWYDVGMWGKPLDTCMLDIRFREKFQDAMAVVISDQERAGLDILSHGDLHVDEDLAGAPGITIRCSAGPDLKAIICSRKKPLRRGCTIRRELC